MIRAELTYPLRHSVLRAGFPPETARFRDDLDVWTFHLGAFRTGALVGVASFKRHSSRHFFANAQYQLRGMAVLPECRGQGLGRALLEAAYPVITAAGCRLLWCNARVSALEFYVKQGFTTIGEQFDTPLAGPHFVMFRNLEH
jgi:[ribosomal protein S5]-alanine N-acetyltransferase